MLRDFSAKTSSAKMLSKAENDAFFIEHILKGDKERIARSRIPLPEAYEKDGERAAFAWVLACVEQKDNAFDALYKDNAAGCSYRVSIRARGDIDGAFEFSSVLCNLGSKEIRIFPGKLFDISFKFDKTPTAWRFAKESGVAEGVKWSKGSAHFEGPGIYKDVLSDGVSVCAETNTCQDFNRGGMIPMTYIDGGDSGAYVGVEWTSQRIITASHDGVIEVCVDYHEGFTTRVAKGGSFTVAPVYIGVYDGDVEDGSNEFKRWFFLEKTPKIMLNNENEPLTQIDCGQIPPDECAEHGIQSIKWDYGWWSQKKLSDEPNAGIWKYYEGSWKLRAEGMINYITRNGCRTLREFGEMMEKKHLNWTVYVLLHDSLIELEGDDQLTSVGPTAHPEWFSNRKIAGKCPVADLGNEECVEYCKRKLQDFFITNKVKSWRSDFEPIAHISDKENRHDANGNDVQYWCSRGFYDIVDHLIENIPGFRYESCSSGGSMKDYATMHRTVVFNNDDSADYVSLRTTFYDSSYCFPPAQLQSPLDPASFCPDCEKYYAGIGDKDFGFRSLIMNAIMLGCWGGCDENGKLRFGLNDYYKEYVNLHNEKIKHLIRYANLYHILPRPDNVHWDGVQYGMKEIPENGVCGAAFIFKPTDTEGNTKRIRPRGLDPKLTYKVNFYERKDQSFTATGKELMENGFDVTMEQTLASEIIFFEV